MSLERKDVRSTLDADVYEKLEILLAADGITQAKFIERVLVPVIEKRIHDATVIAAKAALVGESRRTPEADGGSRSKPEKAGISGGPRR